MSGCNCGKPKPAPHGAAKPNPADSGGLSSRTQSFTLQLSSGKSQQFTGSLLEAQAKIVRLGGGTIQA